MVNVARATGTRAWTVIGLLVTGGLYAVSFCLPAMQPMRDGTAYSGWEAFGTVMTRPLRLPPLSPLDLLSILPMWLSNPLLWVGLVLWTKNRWWGSAVAGILALIGGTTFPEGQGTVVFLPAAIFEADSGLCAGYFMWLASMLVLVVLSIVSILIVRIKHFNGLLFVFQPRISG